MNRNCCWTSCCCCRRKTRNCSTGMAGSILLCSTRRRILRRPRTQEANKRMRLDLVLDTLPSSGNHPPKALGRMSRDFRKGILDSTNFRLSSSNPNCCCRRKTRNIRVWVHKGSSTNTPRTGRSQNFLGKSSCKIVPYRPRRARNRFRSSTPLLPCSRSCRFRQRKTYSRLSYNQRHRSSCLSGHNLSLRSILHTRGCNIRRFPAPRSI